MCGIVGYWRRSPFSERSHEEQTLRRMMRTLHHRGPDGDGLHIDPSHGLAMGHTRLTVIDLHTGDQPLYGMDKRRVWTANGEFYEYKQARADLACRGHQFTTKSDSEVALRLYEEHGLDFLDKLRGEFAIALYDGGLRRLSLIRDRFGIKPLYYCVTDDAIYWASECKALLAHPAVPRRLSRRAALNQLMQTTVPGATAFDGIHALRPGHMLVVQETDRGLQVEDRRYWDLEFPQAKDHVSVDHPETFIKGVADRMIDAVRVRLEADVPVGCYLSGGIDSCSILGMATAMQQSPVKAFTISFDDDQYDEASIARAMAERTNADQELLELTAAELYGDSYVRTLWHAERTFYNTLGVAKWHMSRRVHECGFKVVVTGEGSDELFGGYPFFKRDYYRHALGGAAGDKERALDRANAVFKGALLSEQDASHPAWQALCGFTPSWIQPWILTQAQARPLLADDVLEELRDYDPVAAIAEQLDEKQVAGRHPLDVVQYTWSKTMLEGQILTWGGDRVDMANSMESRPAFLDHHVAQYAVGIPPGLRIKDGVEKWVLREAMKGVLPEVLYKREKFAFMAPPAHTDQKKQAAIRKLVDEYLNPERIRAGGLFDVGRVGAFLEGVFSDQDRAQATRKDIILNHVLGLAILQTVLIDDPMSLAVPLTGVP